jgi:hypothetical protein
MSRKFSWGVATLVGVIAAILLGLSGACAITYRCYSMVSTPLASKDFG